MLDHRFQDQNKTLSDFRQKVLAVCPKCGKKAVASADYEKQNVQLFCEHCGYSKRKTTEIDFYGNRTHWVLPANEYFNAELWLKHPFNGNFFFVYNEEHLTYLESYIGALLREHKDRTHFTLLEKLPKFYHDAKNRETLLKIIGKLRDKK